MLEIGPAITGFFHAMHDWLLHLGAPAELSSTLGS